jgi:hypothetical protein
MFTGFRYFALLRLKNPGRMPWPYGGAPGDGSIDRKNPGSFEGSWMDQGSRMVKIYLFFYYTCNIMELYITIL